MCLYACCGLLCPAYPQHYAHGSVDKIPGYLGRMKEVAAGSALPGHAGHGLAGVQLCGRRAVCGRCRGICEQRRKSHAVCKICHSER
ncbi:hypothetical protein [Escherichia albertii]|uniref:hypothetical protein n=1 Tax=Escherichia albertii TaxID=208962 RepID=UPI002948BCCF|nr:hypothetical protein [Escherichia albertii]